ncbi:adenylosuccinate synthase [Desulfonatronospira sp.]|uniref:adenylosuccinate synthase n=1 Tax=Desulfonatronospira sp. TaxID=1962951 RepID=UPI0025BB931B|nr:adenylosuccinate synthase [Desulfonatronospira sp.]
MSSIVVFGTQWGDEGKGKIVDLLTERAHVIVRFQGGNNAGHTLVTRDKKYILHLIPSGILHPDKLCLIGNGVVLDPEILCREMDDLHQGGIEITPASLGISKKTHLIMPYHKELDRAREQAKSGKDRIGTTGRGIGPCYEDKMSRVGIRAGDMQDRELLLAKIKKALPEKNALLENLYKDIPLEAEEVMQTISPYTDRLVPYLTDVSLKIQEARESGRTVMFEGAQGVQLDIDHGTYPFVTSSNTITTNASAGTGSYYSMDEAIGVVKAYTTRVGQGPFPTQQDNDVGEHMQVQGAEYGSTTGRKRRCGWLDLVILREAVRICGPTALAITKLDVMSGLDTIRVCTAYKYRGQEILYPPQEENAMSMVRPVYQELPGWSEDISLCSNRRDLPRNARMYIEHIEDALKTPAKIISVGPDREQTIR